MSGFLRYWRPSRIKKDYRVLGRRLFWLCTLHGFTQGLYPSRQQLKLMADDRRGVLHASLHLRGGS